MSCSFSEFPFSTKYDSTAPGGTLNHPKSDTRILVASKNHVAEIPAMSLPLQKTFRTTASNKILTAKFMLHFTPTAASWMNAIEDFLSKFARQKLKHAIFNSLDECIAAIKEFHCSSKRQWRPPGPLEHEPDGLGVAWKKGHPKLQELESRKNGI